MIKIETVTKKLNKIVSKDRPDYTEIIDIRDSGLKLATNTYIIGVYCVFGAIADTPRPTKTELSPVLTTLIYDTGGKADTGISFNRRLLLSELKAAKKQIPGTTSVILTADPKNDSYTLKLYNQAGNKAVLSGECNFMGQAHVIMEACYNYKYLIWGLEYLTDDYIWMSWADPERACVMPMFMTDDKKEVDRMVVVMPIRIR